MKGMDVIDTALALLSVDPASLLCQRPNCAVCPKSRELVRPPADRPAVG